MPQTVFTKFASKKKRANLVIKKQGARSSLAQRLGHDVRVVCTDGRVSIEGVYWYPPRNDLSIPSSYQAKLACVQTLVAAMCNNQGVKDKPSTGFLNRWGNDANHYTPEELYACGWEMVDFMVDLHTKGWTQKTYDHKLREQWQQTMFSTFEERFEALVLLLARSKRTCDDIMKRERFYTAIGNPWEIEGRSSSNSKSNGDKGKKLKILTNGEHPEIVEQVKRLSAAKRKREGEPEDVARPCTARPRKQPRTRK
ncbi:hypothetical protein BDU57DRAFT_449671 [Ampelomyces quisqualis]|uniref:Uncharacterized protein n=1 Tax=Ampelomyces quisqualis TaxID=50730 RepID=A0A6A5QRI1_AMPQU|nr:hypothetical protein BDU57DRAFT_449671 [Ampelomyces quisqualis]